MMKFKPVSDEEYAHFVRTLIYHPEIGRFTRKRSKGGGKAGLAGFEHSGMSGRPNPTGLMYRYIAMKGREYGEHQLVFLAETGLIPIGIDHKNGNGLDNRFCNLRVAGAGEQIINTPARLDNKSGLKGVSYLKNAEGKYQYRAGISHKGKRIHLGWFNDKEQAAAAYRLKSEELYGEFAYSNRPAEVRTG